MKGYWYLATPFSNYKDGLAVAAKEAAEHAAEFIKAGHHVFSPIAHSYFVSTWGSIDPLDLDLWLRVDRPMMEAAEGLVVITMPGWTASKGVLHEIDYFTKAKKPIVYWAPGTSTKGVTW